MKHHISIGSERFSQPIFVPFVSFVVFVALFATPASAQPQGPLSVPPPGKAATEQIPMLKDVGIDQHLDAKLPLDLT